MSGQNQSELVGGSHRIFRDFELATSDAGGALSRANQPWMFDRADWFRLAAKHTQEGAPLVVKGENTDSACWLFLNQNGHSAHALSNWYCLRYGVVTNGPNPPYTRLLEGLRNAGISHLWLGPTNRQDNLVRLLRRAGWIVRREAYNVSWRIKTTGLTFEEYWSGRPSRLKNTHKRKAKKAQLECTIHKTLDATIWSQVTEVFDNSWKKRDGTPGLTFDLFELEAKAGTLRLGLAFRNGQPVAAQLWTIEHGVAIIHLLSYREDSKHLSAGTILSHEMFKHAIDHEKADLIDFGYGDHSYKREWMQDRVPLYSLTAYHALSFSGLRAIARMIGHKIKNLGNRK